VERRGLSSQFNVDEAEGRESDVSLIPPEKVGTLLAALHAKAKESPNRRFHSLYDKVYRRDVLKHAYDRCRANGGAPGVDGWTFADVESYGVDRWLSELAEDLRNRTYRPQAVRRVMIPKADGKERPLGIPTIRDRVAQTAAAMLLGAILEADLTPEQYAYRPDRSALDAVARVRDLLKDGYTEVVDADLSGYFDSIPHAELMKSVSRRVSDGSYLALIKMWLEAAVEETDETGDRRRTTRNKDEGKGTPQGAPISPLLANLYMRRFVLGWKQGTTTRGSNAQIVNYADDFVICCRSGADEAMVRMRSLMERLKLTVNERKTRLCRLPDETFDFLGYTFGRLYSPRTGRAYLGLKPSEKKVSSLCEEISALTQRTWTGLSESEQVARLNRKLRGWSNYFRLGTVSRSYRRIDYHVQTRLRRWLCAKTGRQGTGTGLHPNQRLYGEMGLIQLVGGRRQDSPKTRAACVLSPRAGCLR
jgi:RNA-directed DNA polymerase